ncbi:hypothetical protein KsCSTR_17170 [Candidatus Kuenenia stuttgartiensis]|uniref:Uncharacterized protein n=1 Tax=Kuenenia stuttgartiensis TaxID=174633 RepID=Q1Q220_KUEST|nr:hypothetical protein KsCSTR_17170 [Candidatus Kuenenia stuttgartiensis]CAJ74065.1 unknown protein [Candidatus Kuenenia stuttgartiensis]
MAQQTDNSDLERSLKSLKCTQLFTYPIHFSAFLATLSTNKIRNEDSIYTFSFFYC